MAKVDGLRIADDDTISLLCSFDVAGADFSALKRWPLSLQGLFAPDQAYLALGSGRFAVLPDPSACP